MNKQEKEVILGQLSSEKAVLRELERQYKRALRDIDERIKILQADNSPSRAYQADYQKTLKKQVEAIIEKLHADEYDSIHKYLTDSYTDGFVGTMYAMGKRSGIHVITPLDQKAAAKAIVTDSKLSSSLYDALGYDMDALKRHVREEITRGIATSLPYEQIARNISNFTDLPLSNANRIVRTEGHRIQQASADDARNTAKAKGADVVKQWDASLDGATRPLHRELDGQIRETDEPFEARGKRVMYPGKFGTPDQDCNCRCVALTRARWALDEKELETLKERAKYFELDKTKDFKEFKEKYMAASNNVKTAEFLPNEKPRRPKRRNYDSDEEYDEAVEKYHKAKDKYNADLEAWAKAQVGQPMSEEELEKWSKNNNVKIGNINGLDRRVLTSYTARYEQLSKEFPIVEKYRKQIGAPFEIGYNPHGLYDAEATHGIEFGGGWRDFEEALKLYGQSIAGYDDVIHGDKTINVFYDHEFGHQVYASLRAAGTDGYSERYKAIKKDLMENVHGKKGMSEYANQNDDELFAEGFAAWHGGEKTEFANEFGKFLRRWIK